MENLNKLPSFCLAYLLPDRKIILIYKGENGYRPSNCDAVKPEEKQALVDSINQSFRVTKAQEKAMLNGSMFGWNTPGADPDHPMNQIDTTAKEKELTKKTRKTKKAKKNERNNAAARN